MKKGDPKVFEEGIVNSGTNKFEHVKRTGRL